MRWYIRIYPASIKLLADYQGQTIATKRLGAHRAVVKEGPHKFLNVCQRVSAGQLRPQPPGVATLLAGEEMSNRSLADRLHNRWVEGDAEGFMKLCKQAAEEDCSSSHSVSTLLAAAIASKHKRLLSAALMEAIYSLLVKTNADLARVITPQLNVALQLRRDEAAAALCLLHNPQLSSEQCEDLLRRAAQVACHKTVEELCSQPAVQSSIGRDAAYRLMLFAVAGEGAYSPRVPLGEREMGVAALVRLPAVQQLGVDEVATFKVNG